MKLIPMSMSVYSKLIKCGLNLSHSNDCLLPEECAINDEKNGKLCATCYHMANDVIISEEQEEIVVSAMSDFATKEK